jgi:hypothetical protein
MPLSINVGLSRKASKDYQSTGVSINVTAELDQSLLARPEELQQEVANLYAQAAHAMDRQAGRPDSQPPPAPGRGYGNGRSGGYRNGNGTVRTANRSNRNGGGMTESQRKAILAIARRAEIDPIYEAEQIIGVPLDDLTLRQASELIDHLKGLAPAGNGR